ncbi:MAG: hypothetical protein HC853_10895 [Anaerolineae bacterium]|nr:hypothetical protein [Anaerolineae bacterium]
MALALDPSKTTSPDASAFKPTTPNQLVWRRFTRHKGAVMGAIGASLVIGFIVIGSIVVPVDQSIRPDPLNNSVRPTALK